MKKILIANRGEIALRIMRTARRMGIKTVAIYSEADRNAPHVRFADEAVCIGAAPSNASYLLGDKIIAVAQKNQADAIHPGYGFLSENADFAQQLEAAGITFIGPKPHAIEVMGNKLAAKETVKAYDIPMVPGTDNAIKDVEEALEIAKKIGFPVLIKAAAGGGGKGMRVAKSLDELPEQLNRAISEATSSFGDGSVFIEKFVTSPRHIEIQVLADQHGNIVHLFERECSIQRRHQKVLEEAPSVVLTPELRMRMGSDAVKVAKSCGYIGAGTVEFLLDDQHNYFFLEMNTRLQVEHPVTEMISGLDLVEQQIRIARNEKLSFSQEDLAIKGHAIELRIYAEDSYNDFLPSIGTLETYHIPEQDNVRVDNGYEEGMDIPVYYDPMIAKLVVYGDSRMEVIQKMIEVIDESNIEGIQTTLPFGKYVLEHDAFRSGNFDTNFVKKYFTPQILKQQQRDEAEIAAKVALFLFKENEKILQTPSLSSDKWRMKR